MKKRYKLKDLDNGDVIGYFDTMREVRKACKDYNIECEGDWMPQLREYNPETGKYKIVEWW